MSKKYSCLEKTTSAVSPFLLEQPRLFAHENVSGILQAREREGGEGMWKREAESSIGIRSWDDRERTKWETCHHDGGLRKRGIG